MRVTYAQAKRSGEMKKNLIAIVFAFVFAFATSATAQEVNPWDEVEMSVDPDSVITAQVITIADLADTIGDLRSQMTATQSALAEKKDPSDAIRGIAADSEKVQAAVKKLTEKQARRDRGNFTKAQKAEIKRLAKEAQNATDNAIVAASEGDVAGVAAAAQVVEDMKPRVEALEAEIAAIKLRLIDSEIRLDEHEDAITDLKSAVEVLRSTQAVRDNPELAAVITDLDARASSADQQLTDKLISLARRVAVLEASRARGMDKATRSAKVDKAVKEAVAGINKKLDRVEDVAYKALTEATVASAKAGKALEKADPILIELSGGGIFSPEIIAAAVPVGLGIMLQKNWFRAALRMEVGLYKEDGDLTDVWNSQLAFYYAWDHVWLGLYGGTYGIGQPYQDEFGYTAGGIIRATWLIKDTGWAWGVEGWIGPAYEYTFVRADPPTGDQVQVYDKFELVPSLVPVGGIRLVFNI